MSVFTPAISFLFDHFQFALIHGPHIPGSYAILFFTASDFTSITSKVMLKILHARLQQYMNHELSDVQAALRKGRETRDQTANICWITEKAREKHLFLLY